MLLRRGWYLLWCWWGTDAVKIQSQLAWGSTTIIQDSLQNTKYTTIIQNPKYETHHFYTGLHYKIQSTPLSYRNTLQNTNYKIRHYDTGLPYKIHHHHTGLQDYRTKYKTCALHSAVHHHKCLLKEMYHQQQYTVTPQIQNTCQMKYVQHKRNTLHCSDLRH